MEIKLNLLSEAKKTEILKKKRFQLIVLHECIYISMIIIYGMILVSLYYVHTLQIKNQKVVNELSLEGEKVKEITEAQQEFIRTNKDLDSLLRLQQEHTIWSEMLVQMQKALPDGVYVEKIATNERKISLNGRAKTRDILLKFQDNLNNTECFENAKVPLADLFTQENVSFQLDFEIKLSCLKPKNI